VAGNTQFCSAEHNVRLLEKASGCCDSAINAVAANSDALLACAWHLSRLARRPCWLAGAQRRMTTGIRRIDQDINAVINRSSATQATSPMLDSVSSVNYFEARCV
jgi:hypothetical protein